MKKNIVLVICIMCPIFLLQCIHKEEFSQSVATFEKGKYRKDITTYVLYPSTIRMFNIKKDSSFNEMVKDIKKVKVIRRNSEKDTITADIVNPLAQDIRKEKFADLMQIQRDNQQIMIFMKKTDDKPSEFIGIINNEKDLLVIDLLGSIPVNLLPALLNGNMDFSGFNQLLKENKKNQPQHNGNHPRN